jgi:uncharacterized protein YciI
MHPALRIANTLALALVIHASPARADDPAPTAALATLDSTRNTYLVVYRRGDRWDAGKPMREQPGMQEHFRYYIELHRQDRLIAGGGFTDDSGGAAVIEAADDAAAAAILAADPAVQAKVFRYELRRWKPNPWEAISRKRAEREAEAAKRATGMPPSGM